LLRVIGHLDLDYFYAQVEEVEAPSLKQRPVIVCVFSGRTDESGVVSTSNYKAREFGVHSGMPIALAKKKLEGRDPAIIKMNHEKYEAVSERIMESLEQMVDVLEPTGIDEAFFDLSRSTEGDFGKARETAKAMKASIFNDEHLTCSVGLGRSKVVAKLCSDFSKPNGLTVVSPAETIGFLEPLPVTKLYGVGPKTASTLEEMSVKTVGELAKVPTSELERRFGRKFGVYLSEAATGTDGDPVVAGLERSQYSRIVTLRRNTKDPREAFEQLSNGIEYVHGKLVASGKLFRTVTAIGIFSDLSTRTKSKSFEAPINGITVLRDTALSLFQDLSKSTEKDYRRVGVRVSGLSGADQRSLSEFLDSGRRNQDG
jgi:DNA polymerase IV (archaeal DinB-like DNA polymerase)